MSRLTGDLSTVVADIMGSLSSLLITAVMDLGAETHDWFGLFSLGLNIGYDDKNFFWSDMLHYRKTSRFAHSLWSIADESAARGGDDAALWSERLKAYALGYMTHVATDVTGHAFVNEKCGGPFRTHWQRHHLIENHIDAKTYGDLHGTDLTYNQFTESALHYRLAFADDGGDARALPAYPSGDESLRGLYVRRRMLDLDSEMPEQLATLIFEAMGRTYNTAAQAGDHGLTRTSPDVITGGDGRPAVSTIQETYATLFRYLKMSTLDGFNHEKPMPPDVFPNLDFPQLTDPHDSAPGEGDSEMSFWDWVLAIVRFIRWIEAVAEWLATILPAIVLDLGTYGPRVLAYYTIELPLFEMIKAERSLLVMTAYFHPMQDEVDTGLIQIGTNNHGNFLAMLSAVDDILVRANAGDRGSRALTGPFWESPDISVLPVNATTAPPVPLTLGSVAQAGVPNTVWAHVWNLGQAPVYNARVEFYWFDPTLGFNAASANLIGVTHVDLGNRTSGLAHRYVKCPVSWTPTYLNNGHECLMARILEPLTDPLTPYQWDASNDRHVGKRNIAVIDARSPATLQLTIRLGCGTAPGAAELQVTEVNARDVAWLSILAGARDHRYRQAGDATAVAGLMYPTLVRRIDDKATLEGVDLKSAAAGLLKKTIAFERGCDELEALFFVHVDGLRPKQCRVYRITQTANGKLVGGYTVIARRP